MTWIQSHSRTLSFLHSNSHWQWGQIFVIVTALHRTLLPDDLAADDAIGGPTKCDGTGLPFHRRLQNLCCTGRSSDLSRLLKPSHPTPLGRGRRTVVSMFRSHVPKGWRGTHSSGNCCRLSRHSLLILPRIAGSIETNEQCKCNEILLDSG
jgi:hypothetical protein